MEGSVVESPSIEPDSRVGRQPESRRGLTAAQYRPQDARSLTSLREWLALIAVSLVAFQRPFPVVSRDSILGYLMYSDIPLSMLICVSLVGSISTLRQPPESRRPSAVALAVMAFWGACFVSALLHPVMFGFVSVTRLAGACLIGGVVATMVRERRYVPVMAVPIAWLGFQVPLGFLQYLRGGTVGLAIFGESSDSFRLFEGVTAASGTLTHRSTFAILGCAVGGVLIALAALGKVRIRHWVAAAATGCGVGLSVSRTGAVTVALIGIMIVVGFAVRRFVAGARIANRKALMLWCCMLVGAAAGGSLQMTAWSARADTVAATGSNLDDVSSGRIAIMRQSVAIWKLDPVFGVGPNRYLLPVLNDPAISAMSSQKVPVHNVWLFVLASTGVVGAACLGALTLLIGWRAWKGGVAGLLVAGAVLPGLMLDVALFIWSGSLVLAFALGTICGLTPKRTGPRPDLSALTPH